MQDKENEKCPTCGSDERDMPELGHIDRKGEWYHCWVCGSDLCPDPWHRVENKEQTAPEASTDSFAPVEKGVT